MTNPATSGTAHHPRPDITDNVIAQWATDRADDAGALARRIVTLNLELAAMKADRPYIIGCNHGFQAALENGETTHCTSLIEALCLVIEERDRQQSVEGFTTAHDDTHTDPRSDMVKSVALGLAEVERLIRAKVAA